MSTSATQRTKRREPSHATTKRPNFCHFLATIHGGQLHIFTGLGEHATAEDAKRTWEAAPRNGVAVIVRQWDAVRLGRVYGTHQELVSLHDLAVLP